MKDNSCQNCGRNEDMHPRISPVSSCKKFVPKQNEICECNRLRINHPSESCKKFIPKTSLDKKSKGNQKHTRQRFAEKNSSAKKGHHKLIKAGMVNEFNSHPAEKPKNQGKKPEGCGKDSGYLSLKLNRKWKCGELNPTTNKIVLCPECSKKNHSPQVDKDTPSGSRKELEGTFNLSKMIRNVLGVNYIMEMDVKKFIKLLKDALKITKESIGLADRYNGRTIVNICAFFEGEIDKLSGGLR